MPVFYFVVAVFGAVSLFAAGIAVGVWLTVFGYKLGWKASYQVRGDPQDDDKSLFGTNEDSAELEILEEQEKNKTNLMSE